MKVNRYCSTESGESVCEDCGALVRNRKAHDALHARIDAAYEEIADLRYLLGDLDPGHGSVAHRITQVQNALDRAA